MEYRDRYGNYTVTGNVNKKMYIFYDNKIYTKDKDIEEFKW